MRSVSLFADTPAADADTVRDFLYRKIARRLLPLLFIGYVVAMLDRNNVAVAKLGFLSELKFNESVFGAGAGLFYLGYVLFEIPSNLLLARIGVRLTLARIMALWFVFSFALAFMTQPWHYFVLRFLLGAAEAGYFPAVLLFLTLWAPRSRRAQFTAFFMSAQPISGMIGAPLAGVLMHGFDGVGGMSGWRWLFLIEGLPAIAMALVVGALLREEPSAAPWLSSAERRLIAEDLAEDENDGHGKIVAASSRLAALKDARIYWIGLQAFALLATLNGLTLWGPTLIKQSGIHSILSVTLMVALPQALGIIAMLGNGALSDRSGERRLHAALPLAVAAVGWLLMPAMLHHPAGVLCVLAIIAAGVFGASAPFWAIPGSYLSAANAPVGIAMITTMGALGSMVSPIIVGWLSDATGSLSAGMWFYGFILIIGIAALLIGTLTGRIRR